MVKTRKSRTLIKNKKNNKKKMGGMLEEHGLPQVNMLSQFQMSDVNLFSFNRLFNAPMDCFINALQLMGVLNLLSANIMRISTLGVTGFTKEQIEIIFSYVYGTNFEFKETSNYQEWSQWIAQYLMPGYAVFSGFTGHVFIIARSTNGTLYYIDPQLNLFCDLSNTSCESYLRDKSTWYLLFNSREKLTLEQEKLIIDYTDYLRSHS